MADVIIPEKDNSLHRVMDVLGEIEHRLDNDAKEQGSKVADLGDQLTEARTENDAMRSTIDELKTRCDNLDAALPKGEKVFRSSVDRVLPARDQALADFGSCFTAARRKARGEELPAIFTREQTEGDEAGAAGESGVLVPTEVYGSIVRIIEEKSIIRQIARVVPMGSDKMDVPVRDGGPTVGLLTEATAPAETAVSFGTSTTLDSKTVGALDSISRELSEDALIAIEPMLAEVFAGAIAEYENEQAFEGTSDFSGVAAAATASSSADISMDALIACKYAIDPRVIDKGVWIIHPNFFEDVVKLADTTNSRPLFTTSYSAAGGLETGVGGGSNGAHGTLIGSPVYFSANANGTDGSGLTAAIFGAFDPGFLFGDRRQLMVEYDDSAMFTSRKRAMLVSERIAMLVALSGCFSKIDQAA